MALSRRKTLALIGGGTIAAATAASAGYFSTRTPTKALAPWTQAGQYDDPRMRHLSYAVLAPNPHNMQPRLVDLRTDGEAMLYVNQDKLLPHTDPFNRQITVGLGCFLELLRIAAAEHGQGMTITPFPDGYDDTALDDRPVARIVWGGSATPDPLFAEVFNRRSTKEPYDTTRPVAQETVDRIVSVAGTAFGTVDPDQIAALRILTDDALHAEIVTPRTYKESVDVMRLGKAEINANPDGIDLGGGPMDLLADTGLLSPRTLLDTNSMAYKEGYKAVMANAKTGMGYIWQVSPTNTRLDQITAGADWLRLNLACTELGVAVQPMSQALQEYQEVAEYYDEAHKVLAPGGGTVQMLGRLGYYAPGVAQSPRWPIDAKVLNA